MKATFVNLTHEKPAWAKDFLVMNSARPLTGNVAEFQSAYIVGSHYALIDTQKPDWENHVEANQERGGVCLTWNSSRDHMAKFQLAF